MRLLDRSEPRWAVLLLVPVLLLAGAVQPPAPPPAAAASADARRGALLLRPATLAEQPAGPGVSAALLSAVAPRESSRRSSRSAPRPGRAPGPQERGQAALDGLGYDWRALGYRVVFVPHTGGELGSANRRTRLITIRVRPAQSELSLRATVAHELGHALDFEHGSAQRRDAYRRIRGLPEESAWFPCDGCDDFRSPAGDFAEVFAAWLVGPGDFRSRLQGPPSAAQLRRLDGLFRLPARPAAAPPAPQPSTTREPEPSEEPRGPLAGLLDPSPPPARG